MKYKITIRDCETEQELLEDLEFWDEIECEDTYEDEKSIAELYIKNNDDRHGDRDALDKVVEVWVYTDQLYKFSVWANVSIEYDSAEL